LYTEKLKRAGIKVIHVIANKKFALKAEAAGVDAIVAEGFEAGGHNGREETTTLCLVPTIVDAVKIPVIAAGGIGSGRAMMAAMALGAQGIQVGTRFVACYESSAHQNFKDAVVAAHEGDTQLSLKQLTPVRLLKNEFWKMVADAESRGASVEELTTLLGRARAKKGMFEGDLAAGELEIGQVSASINGIATAAEIVNQIWDEFIATKNKISALSLD
jgi:enoyl-[acyl-carrier protein] reductase II